MSRQSRATELVESQEKQSEPPRNELLFPFLDLQAQFNSIREEIWLAVKRVLESQHFILGPEVQALEKELVALIGATDAVSCASGSDALLLALLALGITSGDEVITTPFTFVATAGAVARAGATPVFVDIDPQTFSIDPKLIESAVTKRTRAIIPVHLFGLAAELDAILTIAREHKLAVIEDAAQAIGARYKGSLVGTLGTFGCFSFFPSKNLGGAGDGGLITTNDPSLADCLRLLRVHGSREKYSYEILGTNSRLDALQAAILRVKLPHLNRWTSARQKKADRYRVLFSEYNLENHLTLPYSPPNLTHVYNQFVIRSQERDDLRKFLRSRGIPTEIYYPMALHLQRAFLYLDYKAGQLPEAETASREVLALPIYPELKEEHQTAVVRTIAEFYAAAN
jgi:dTDP-4-amino-4,6-dideoxygalactose transaminase